MKIARALGLVLAAAVVPAVASAQSTNDPNSTTTTTTTTNTNANPNPTAPPAPPVPVAPTTTDPMPAPPPPTAPITTETQTTTVPPVVVVQPSAPTSAPVYQTETEEQVDAWNAPVFTTGAILFGGSYAAAAIVSGESDHVGADRLWVPVVGPWLALNDWGSCPIDQPRCDTNTTDKVLLIADGVVQAAGILTMVDGLLQPSSHKVIRRTADTKVHVAPTGNGMMVFGHF
jgi:hypothetical protein